MNRQTDKQSRVIGTVLHKESQEGAPPSASANSPTHERWMIEMIAHRPRPSQVRSVCVRSPIDPTVEVPNRAFGRYA